MQRDDVVELSNGCICCTVADEFIPTMEMLLGRDNPPDHIVIETSRLALLHNPGARSAGPEFQPAAVDGVLRSWMAGCV
jgi:cobalamin biosynthesis protein CobW